MMRREMICLIGLIGLFGLLGCSSHFRVVCETLPYPSNEQWRSLLRHVDWVGEEKDEKACEDYEVRGTVLIHTDGKKVLWTRQFPRRIIGVMQDDMAITDRMTLIRFDEPTGGIIAKIDNLPELLRRYVCIRQAIKAGDYERLKPLTNDYVREALKVRLKAPEDREQLLDPFIKVEGIVVYGDYACALLNGRNVFEFDQRNGEWLLVNLIIYAQGWQ